MSKPSTPGGQPASNTLLLRRQLTELTKHPVEGFSAGQCEDIHFSSLLYLTIDLKASSMMIIFTNGTL